MPYKDKQKQKEWHHNAYLRKRAGLPTRTTPILTIEEKNKRKQYWNKISYENLYEKKKTQICH